MHVKGIAFLARQAMMVAEHGEQKWRDYVTAYAERVPFFRNPVMPVTQIPAELFVAMQEDIVRTFYKGDPRTYWRFGEQSGRHAITQGQLRGVFGQGDYLRFLQFTPRVWKGYFDEGQFVALKGDSWADLHLTGVPVPHRYYEESVMAFASGALQALGMKQVRHDVLKSFKAGEREVLYRFHLA
jgi:hypothetical protein